jgi:hypothetical protein
MLAIASVLAVIWSIFKYQTVYYALINSFPLKFQDPLTSRYAFPEIALSPSTPLPLQAEYLKSLIGFCLAALGFSLFCFFIEKTIVGWILFFMFLGFAALTIKSGKAYKANCNRTNDP